MSDSQLLTSSHANLRNSMQKEGLPFRFHQSTVKILFVEFHMILDVKNHKGMLKMFQQETPSPSRSHPVTAVRGGYPSLAHLSFLSTGTSHAWHPWQPLGTALTTAPLKKHAHNSFHAKQTDMATKGGKALATSWPISQNAFDTHELTSPFPSAESWSSWRSPEGFYRNGQESCDKLH